MPNGELNVISFSNPHPGSGGKLIRQILYFYMYRAGCIIITILDQHGKMIFNGYRTAPPKLSRNNVYVFVIYIAKMKSLLKRLICLPILFPEIIKGLIVKSLKMCASAGSRTRVDCLEGNHANRYTTDASHLCLVEVLLLRLRLSRSKHSRPP